VVVFGSATVDGLVEGDMVVVIGSAELDGTVRGNLTVPAGSLTMGPNARVSGDVMVVGGKFEADPTATVGGERRAYPVPAFEGIRGWLTQGLLLGRPLPHQPGWWWWVALACAALSLLASAILPGPIEKGVEALEAQPVASFFLGVLASILFVIVLMLLAATGVGLLIIPFLLCAAVGVFVLGKAALYQSAGYRLTAARGSINPRSPLTALLIGMVLFYVIYMVPVLGFLVWGVVAPVSLGAAVMGLAQTFRAELPQRSAFGVPSTAPLAAMAPSEQRPLEEPSEAMPPIMVAEQRSIDPAEAISLPRAGFLVRLAASFVDLLLVGALIALLDLPGRWFLVGWVAYHIGFWTWKGTTIGGVVFGVKIVKRDGRPLDFPVALIRCLAAFLSGVVLFLGFFWVGWTQERVSWHDSIAGTIVLKVPQGAVLV